MVFSAETFPILVKHHIFWYNLGFPNPLIGNQVRHILIILSFLLLSPFLTSCEKYVGEHKDGKYQGQGTYTWKDGGKYVGDFKDGELWNGIFYEKNGNIIEKWVNGVKQ